MEVLACIPKLACSRADEVVADALAEDRAVGLEEGRRAAVGLLAADGVVPEGTGAVVLGALEMTPAGGGGVLELLVAVVAVVLAQRHLLLLSSPSAAPSGSRSFFANIGRSKTL